MFMPVAGSGDVKFFFVAGCAILEIMLRQIVVAMLLTVWFFPPAARAETPSSQQQRQQQTPAQARTDAPGGVRGTAAEIERLLERERQAQKLQDFEGGGINMTTTTLIIVLLLIIVIILIV
jgi:hypothetical protein